MLLFDQVATTSAVASSTLGFPLWLLIFVKLCVNLRCCITWEISIVAVFTILETAASLGIYIA